ncbi:Gfo/Idh/MocA family oxidoreductase [Paenibacillus algorifonticola]|uniref:Gfo/Idh/MocA family protein n=1 Tax=Paenibacillus algorifonticola TaxID=684063 RepID=UPI003D2C6DA4
MLKPIPFGIIGFGWRAEAYLRISKQLPHLFKIVGIVVRDTAKYQHAADQWGVPLYSTPQELAQHCEFLVAAVSKASMPHVLKEAALLDIPLLAETPPAFNDEGYQLVSSLIQADARIQIAEQYLLQPHHQARTTIIQSGSLGEVRHVQVSAAHGYHGISLIRQWLSVTDSNCHIVSRHLELPIQEVPHRGRAAQDRLETEIQDISIITFGDGKSAVLDFARSQYFSPIRHNRILIRGSKGEIRDNEVTRYLDANNYEDLSIRRMQDGLEGSLAPLSLRELRAGSECLYRNPYHPAQLSDEEIAMAEVLTRMTAYAAGGESFYSLAEALIDVRLSLAIDESIATGNEVKVL